MNMSFNDYDDSDDVEENDIIDSNLEIDDNDEEFIKPVVNKLDVRRRLEEYLEEVKLKRELELY
ncbi:MAG: hypothetical protein OQK95_11955 [Gammaproteobacteria bacterium]|nr:hypothetical protein [Gammaproteobacteria bacterium]